MTSLPNPWKAKPADEYELLQPRHLSWREAGIGSLLMIESMLSLVSAIFCPESFAERHHQLIYSAYTLCLRRQVLARMTSDQNFEHMQHQNLGRW